jgi:hypothetical protein
LKLQSNILTEEGEKEFNLKHLAYNLSIEDLNKIIEYKNEYNKNNKELITKVASDPNFESNIKFENIGKISDTYHTFDNLYNHRTLLFATICNANPKYAWKSKKHSNPKDPMYEGMFIAGLETPIGQATYHIEQGYWRLFNIQELTTAPEWDGHGDNDAILRIFWTSWNRDNEEFKTFTNEYTKEYHKGYNIGNE